MHPSVPAKSTAKQRPSTPPPQDAVQSKVFEANYAKLNEKQQLAVDTVEGPLMVVAGPGTGKTQVLAMRAANILQKTHAKPSNILCLTYSVSGVTAMRDRLASFIGPDAYGVNINTVHGFCNEVISQHREVFPDWSALTQISDVERYRELNKIIDQLLPQCELVSRKSPYSRTRDILSRITQLKREGVVDERRLSEVADAYDNEMKQKSKPGTKVHERNLATARKFRELLEIYKRYQAMLKETGRYDYEDMILYVLQALREEDWLLAALQERYQYILVDEFQDFNGAQYNVLELLTEDPTGDSNPNLFVVGDDDQSIYRFQGANLQHILAFHERFANAPVITLTQSYRCTQQILDRATTLIGHNSERLVGKVPGVQKDLVSATGAVGPEPKVFYTPSDVTEPWQVAELVQEHLDNGVPATEIAVLGNTNADLHTLYDVLTAKGIPVDMHGKADLLKQPSVLQALAILRAILNPEDSSLLSGALGSSCFGCHPADLGRLYILRRKQEATLLQVLLDAESIPDLRDPESLFYARDTLLDLWKQRPTRTILHTFQEVYRSCKLLEPPSDTVVDPLFFAPLTELFENVQNRSQEFPSLTLEQYLEDIAYYQNDSYGELRMQYHVPHLIEEGVQLRTAHQSKGLEFQVVILPQFRLNHWDKRRRPPSIAMPEDLLFGWSQEKKTYWQSQDERRLAYVAITRAKEHVILLCPKALTIGDRNVSVSPSEFVSEAGIHAEETLELKEPAKASTLLHTPQREVDTDYTAFLRERVENFTLSPTALNDFLTDPEHFRDRHLLRIPERKDATLAYGNAVHHTLAKWAHSVQEGSPMTPNTMVEFCTKHMQKQEVMTKAELENFQAEAGETLLRYAEQKLAGQTPVIDRIEYGMRARLGDIPIKGKVDRIDLLQKDGKKAHVIDYKTGKPKSDSEIQKYGYHRQLVFYSLLIEQSTLMLEPESYILEFVGDRTNAPKTVAYSIGDPERAELTEMIQNVWQKIVALDFTPL